MRPAPDCLSSEDLVGEAKVAVCSDCGVQELASTPSDGPMAGNALLVPARKGSEDIFCGICGRTVCIFGRCEGSISDFQG